MIVFFLPFCYESVLQAISVLPCRTGFFSESRETVMSPPTQQVENKQSILLI